MILLIAHTSAKVVPYAMMVSVGALSAWKGLKNLKKKRNRYMSKYKKINKDTICKLVYAELDKLPKQYVVVMDMRRSRGAANVNIGGTKFELHVKIFDTDVEDWTHAPNVGSFTFEDSDGIIWWPDIYSAFVKHIKELLKNARREE